MKADELRQLLQPARRAVLKEGDPGQLLRLCPSAARCSNVPAATDVYRKSVGRICTTPLLFNFVQVFSLEALRRGINDDGGRWRILLEAFSHESPCRRLGCDGRFDVDLE